MQATTVCGVKIAVGKKSDLLSSATALIGVGGMVFTPNL